MTPSHCSKSLSTLLLLCLFYAPALLLGNSGCEALAKTDLEQLFCAVEARGVPLNISFKEFRNNPIKTQRLLLARPAKKLGLVLPAEVKSPQTPDPKQNPRSAESALPLAPSLSRCAIREAGIKIVCAHGNYRLLGNVANRQLDQRVFGADNRLNLPDVPEDNSDIESTQRYLARTYAEYLSAMERLGLSSATMSYTRFHLTYYETQKLGLDFSERMAEMYELLKREKSSMDVAGNKAREMPSALNQCYALAHDRLVCDNKHDNWVYRLEKP